MNEQKSFAETAMEMAGKSEQEVKKTGQIDAADDKVEKLFEERHKTVNSPVHKAVWGTIDLKQFDVSGWGTDVTVVKEIGYSFGFGEVVGSDVMNSSYDIIKRYQQEGNILVEGKHNPEMIEELADVGYFGTLVELPDKPKMKFRDFVYFLSRNARINAQVAGLSSVHGCIGAVDPIMTFGTSEQKDRFLPRLAAGVQSGFALTEPNAGSDLTALRTTATLEDDGFYHVNGEKLFITNVHYGGIIGLVCKDAKTDKLIVLIVDLPESDNENFYMKSYGLHALKEMYNKGLVFKDFKVPANNLIQEDGLIVAYHGLNYGRSAVCANASGCMRRMLHSMLPWTKFRETYGEKIEKRELVQRRIAKLMGYICGSEALTHWSSKLLDEGFRGELECIIAKIFGSEMQKDAAIELCMKTHGGRSFLHGHLIGDNIHEFLAPCIYEGEGEMLGMAFFKSLVKDHGKTYYEKIGKIVGKPTFMNILKALLKSPGTFTSYLKWRVFNLINRFKIPRGVNMLNPLLQPYARFAIVGLSKMSTEIDKAMLKHQLKLADRQCRMSFLSQKTQDLVTMLVTVLYANWIGGLSVDAAIVLCTELECKIKGRHLTDDDYRFMTKFGAKVVEKFWKDTSEHLNLDEILMPY